jgi:outer membrane lipoprotein SlyB
MGRAVVGHIAGRVVGRDVGRVVGRVAGHITAGCIVGHIAGRVTGDVAECAARHVQVVDRHLEAPHSTWNPDGTGLDMFIS